ncbi:hypothetical protein [Methylobacterium indicum]|jgi:hypothetical protein|uniref:hypothetical protein n=1 Tax=Methylobacterium indicum TaxID=1775910 RepID=UPI000B253FE2|nr:hypothetical protein [Methylobacterium indicum]
MTEPNTLLSERLSEADIETLKEIIRNAESHLGGQLTLGVASNQRALTLTSLFGTGAVVIGGAAGSLLLGQFPRLDLGIVCVIICIGLLISMRLAISAALPTDWYVAGNTPSQWASDVGLKISLKRSLAEQAAWYASMISDNDSCMKFSNKRLTLSLKFAWGSLVAGGVLGIIVVAAARINWQLVINRATSYETPVKALPETPPTNNVRRQR